jgi:hypothetical protein
MTIFDNYFPLALGTSRFPVSGSTDHIGIEKSAKLVLAALDLGINYIDTALQYSGGAAPNVLKMAFSQTKKPFDVTVKVSHIFDKTSDDTKARVEQSLKLMGLERAKFFVCWTIFNYCEFEKVMGKGGIYDGAVKLKDEGLIDHICLSTHASPKEIIKMIETGAFEGITICYSPLHATLMQPVLDKAQKQNVGVAVMNPLGGGIIAQNSDYFSFVRGADEKSTVVAALRFAKAHPAVNLVLSGISNEDELNENIQSITEKNSEPDNVRHTRVIQGVKNLNGFCTGCNYCEGCPQGFPVSHFMQARNTLLFDPVKSYNRTSPNELLYDIQVFRKLQLEFGYLPKALDNSCYRCGQCEAKCTQKLEIINGLDDTFKRAKRAGYSIQARKNRIKELVVGKGYKRVGLYPNGGFANLIMELYEKYFGQPDFEWIQFNSDPKTWGMKIGGALVHSPKEIPKLKPDIIIVSTYRFDMEIYESLLKYEKNGILVKNLHYDKNVPWIY